MTCRRSKKRNLGRELPTRVKVKTLSTVQDDFGEEEAVEILVGEFWCKVTAKPMSMVGDNNIQLTAVNYELKFRYSTVLKDLPTGSIIEIDDYKLKLITVDLIDHSKRFLRVTAEKIG